VAQAVVVTYRVNPTPDALAVSAAEFFTTTVVAAVKARGLVRVAISGGTTPKALFSLLANPSAPYFAQIPWNRLQIFWVDERSVPPTDADSNYRMTREALLSHLSLPSSQVYRIEGELDPEVAAARYEATIRTAFRLEGAETPVFDLVLLGLGEDGHTASLFPHTAAIYELARIAIANHVPQKESWRITLTWPVLIQAREVAFLVGGASKTQPLHDMLLGPYDPEAKPAQLIRPTSGRLTLLLDAAAASKLPPPSPASAVGTLQI
jgi:6-phosphogluconolactonase